MQAESDGWKHKPAPSAINHDHYRSHKGHEGEKHLSVPATVEEDTHVGSPLNGLLMNGLLIRRSKSDAGR